MPLTHMRLNQITGSVVDFKPAAINRGAVAADFSANDLSGSLQYFAQAISNIHGNVEFGNQVLGKISHDGRDVVLETTTSGKVHLNSAGALEFDGTSGVFDVTGGMSFDAATASNVTVTGAGQNLTLAAAGGGAQKVLVQSAGTNDDAFEVATSAGNYKLAGSKTSGQSIVGVADGATLRLGETGGGTVVEITPTNVGATEKILVKNQSGTAADAIAIQSVAGSMILDMDASAGKVHVDSEGTSADAIDLDSAGGIDIDAVGTFAMDANAMSLDATAASNITVTAGADAQDLIIQMLDDGTPRDSSIAVISDGTGSDAIMLDASAGGIQINVQDDNTVSIGKASAVELQVTPHSTAGNEKFHAINTGGTAADAIKLQSVAGGLLLDMDASGGKIHIDSEGTGGDAVDIDSAGGVDILAAGALQAIGTGGATVGVDGTYKIAYASNGNANVDFAGLDMDMAQGDITATTSLHLSGSSVIGEGVSLSGSIVFSADGGMTSGGGQNGMLLANESEFSVFRAKSSFSASTTLLGAINSLADSVAGTEPTLFKNKLTAGVVKGANIQVAKVAGDASDLSAHAPQKMQLYYNGQQLLSGSAAEFAADDCDYVVVGDGSSRNVQLNFHADVDDLIQVWDFS